MSDQTHATANQALSGDKTIETDPGVDARKMDRNEGIEHKCPRGTIGHSTSTPPSDSTLDILIKAVLAGLFHHEWVHHEDDRPRAVVVEKSDEWLRWTVRIPARYDNEGPSGNAHRIVRRATAYHIGLARRTSITSELGYRIVMPTSGDLRPYPQLRSCDEVGSRL